MVDAAPPITRPAKPRPGRPRQRTEDYRMLGVEVPARWIARLHDQARSRHLTLSELVRQQLRPLADLADDAAQGDHP